MDEINKQTTSLQISKPSTIVGLIKSKRFQEISESVPNSVAAIMDSTPICVLKREVDLREIQKAIEFELIKVVGMLNVANNMKPHQVSFTAQTIIENYPAESIEDIILCLKRGAMGYYGSTFHQFDTSIVLGWLGEHIDEKCNYLEKGTKATQDEEKQLQVDYEAFKKKIEQKRKELELREANEREIDIRRFVDKNGGRKAWTVEVVDAEDNLVGKIENVYAETQDMANQIVIGMINRNEIKL
jgi:hypothetical protein